MLLGVTSSQASTVKVEVNGSYVKVTGPRGNLDRTVDSEIRLHLEDGRLVVTRPSDEPRHRAMHGLTRALIANMVIGVENGFRKTLELVGVGYRAQKQGTKLVLALGFSHPVEIEPPGGISFEVEGPRIHVDGIDKELVGQVAANIRKLRPPEPYLGKGIRYQGERVRRPNDDHRGELAEAGLQDLERFSEMARDPSGGVGPIAAIIVETVQGEGGLNAASDGWLRKLAEIAKDIGALLIVDDIQAGCGRTGDFFSFERAGIVPDMVCLSKSIGGGLPMSLMLVKPEFDIWQAGEHSGTFRGNSLAFVAGASALSFWMDGEFIEGLQERSRLLARWCDGVAAEHGDAILRDKGRGMMRGVEFATTADAKAVADCARKKGVLLETCGPSDQVLADGTALGRVETAGDAKTPDFAPFQVAAGASTALATANGE